MFILFLLVIILSTQTFAQTSPGDFLDLGKLPYLKNSKLIQISSNDPTGGNADFLPIGIGETKVLADIKGAGVVTRIWVTISAEDKYYLRRLLLRMYWDGEKNPSVECPVGDFFGDGFSYTQWTSYPLGMSSGGYYCYFPMPFANGAKIELVNESGMKVPSFYYHIDYQQIDSLTDPDVGRFHCQWRREPRTDPKQNYLILDAEGRGQFVGTILEMQGYGDKQITFLEGDEFVYVDGETNASIRGTGTEDYFTSGWYFNRGTYSGPLHGLILKDDTLWSRIIAYRFHFGDQIPFRKNIRFTIEHGHANEELGDYASVAFWYQAEPHKTFEPIMPGNRRIPLRVVVPGNAIEGESLIANAATDGGNLQVQDMSSFGVDWSGDHQLLFKAGQIHSSFSLSLPVKEPDSYRVYAFVAKGPTYGNAEIIINGKRVGEFNGYNGETIPGGKITLDKVRLLESPATVTFRVTGKDPAANGYDIGVDAFVLAPERNFIRDWYVIGPFDNPGDIKERAGLTTAYAPEKEFNLKKVYQGKDRINVRWKQYSGSPDGFVDLNDALKPHDLALGYALSYIYTPDNRPIRIYIGSDDGIRMWVNDKLLHDNFILRGSAPDQDTVNVTLKKGWNKVLLKIENNLGGWGFYCRIPDPKNDLLFNTIPSMPKKK